MAIRPGTAARIPMPVFNLADGDVVLGDHKVVENELGEQGLLIKGRFRKLVVRLDGEPNTNTWSYRDRKDIADSAQEYAKRFPLYC